VDFGLLRILSLIPLLLCAIIAINESFASAVVENLAAHSYLRIQSITSGLPAGDGNKALEYFLDITKTPS